ncbi:NTP transferase domain-containing protein [Thermodesulfobacteriota bacterium]
MTDTGNIAALILAAGRSTRMGTFKPLLPMKGSTVIGQVIDNTRAAGIKEILVVAGYRAETLIPVLRKTGVDWVVNPAYQQEMFSSIKIGVDYLSNTIRAFFLLPGDMPFVRPRTFKKLLAAFDPEEMDLLKPTYRDKSGHPVLISSDKFPAIKSFVETGGLRTLIRKQSWRTVKLECDDPGILTDLDNPQDYEAVSALAKPDV